MDFLRMILDRIFHRKQEETPMVEPEKEPPTLRKVNSSTKIVLCSPIELDETENVVDILQSGCSVLLNLERDRYDVARRLLDFVAGVAYHNENQIQQVAPRAFLIAPYDAEIKAINF